MVKKKKITNVDVSIMRDDYSANFEYDGARYHVWFEPATREIRRGHFGHGLTPTLYKNPLNSVKHRGPGWFDTRRLNASVKQNAKLIESMWAEIDKNGLIAKAEAERERIIKARAEIRKQEAAGPKLYEAAIAACAKLKEFAERYKHCREALDILNPAIELAEKGKPK